MAAAKTTAKEAEKKVTAVKESAEEISRKYAEERIEYIAQRPSNVDPKTKEVTVTINGYNYRVQYGKKVIIPRFVAEVLDRAITEGEKISEKIEQAKESRDISEY